MNALNYIFEGLAFLFITILIFNELIQLFQILGIFVKEDIRLIGSISCLLATTNLLSKRFFEIKLFN